MVMAKPSQKHFFTFVNYDTALEEADDNPNVGLRSPIDGHDMGMRESLEFANSVYLEGKKVGRAVVLAIFNTPVDVHSADFVRCFSLWVDPASASLQSVESMGPSEQEG
jgi:hypothetical protein